MEVWYATDNDKVIEISTCFPLFEYLLYDYNKYLVLTKVSDKMPTSCGVVTEGAGSNPGLGMDDCVRHGNGNLAFKAEGKSLHWSFYCSSKEVGATARACVVVIFPVSDPPHSNIF